MSASLAQISFDFAAKTHSLPEHILNNEGWGWDAYAGIRYGFLHVTLELRRLAAAIAEKRTLQSTPQTRVQKLLAQHQAAFRDYQALWIGIDEELLDRTPALGEWTLRTIFNHVHSVERYFFAHILNALDNDNPQPLNNEQIAAIVGEPAPTGNGTLAALWASYSSLHERIATRLATLNDAELQLLSPMWEPEPVSIEFRILRFAAHIREHANQLEKSLWQLERRPNEAKMLLRQLYAALAEAEGEQIGAGELCDDLCQQSGEILKQRIAAMLGAVEQAKSLIQAVESGNVEAVRSAIAQNKGWARTEMPDGLSALVFCKYRGNAEMAGVLQSALSELSLHEAAIVGNLEEIEAWLTYQPQMLNSLARDGFSPLQLASFFGQPAAVRRLLAAGADIHAVSQNQMRIQPIHAAVAAHNLEIVKTLIAAGCDVNAKQQDDFTPLMGAIQNKDEEMVKVLREAGARG